MHFDILYIMANVRFEPGTRGFLRMALTIAPQHSVLPLTNKWYLTIIVKLTYYQ